MRYRYIFSLIFLGLTVYCQAQKWPKNEVSVGYAAGYFFDTTEFKLTAFEKGRHLTLAYTRNLTPKVSISANFANYFFAYVGIGEIHQDNTVLHRLVRRASLSGLYNLPTGLFHFRLKAGLNYCWGYKLIHYYYFPPNIGEPVSEGVSYKKWGVVTGLGIEHKIVWGLFGSINADYVRMFKGIDPNQLYLSYALGYRF